MKLHLPYRLYRTLLAVLAAIPTWIYATPAATIPEGYTAHNVSTIEDVTTYSGSDKQSFLLEQDLIFDASPTFNTSLFFTSADAGNLASLTFQNYNGKNVWKREAGDSLTLQGLSVITIQNSQNSSYEPLRNNGGNVLIKENGSVLFSRNYSYGSAGAIRNVRGEFTLSGNGSVSFSGNSASYTNSAATSSFAAYGGAIYNNGTFTLSGTGSVVFDNNKSAGYGGAIYNTSGTFTLSGNDSVVFNSNVSPASGGAIYNASGTFTLSGNGSVVFNNNMSSASGGAIYNNTSGTFSINGNDSVSFIDNSSGIDSVGGLNIANNGTVIFRGNKRSGLTFSAQTTSSQLTLSARPGGSIEFDDQVSITKADAAKDFQVSYNRMFEDEQGGQHAQTGDIVFAGKNSGVSAMSNLYDGRLIMKDGAVYEGQGITVHSSVSGASTPTLRLGNGQLRHSGYGITVESGAALELAGVNTVTASSLTMQEGSRLNVYVGTEHADASALTLTGNWEMGGHWTSIF